jgi:cell wall-associated NlpC family hydrolase
LPVSAIAPNPTAPAADPARPPTAQQSASFATALDTATARFDPTRLPTVSIGQMVNALVAADPQRTADIVAAASAPAGVASASTASLPAGSAGAEILAAGERYLGVPYKWGGTSASGLDCSGFVQRAFGDLGISLPRVSVDQAKAGTSVGSLAEARPGDLVFWYGDGKRPNHIGIYAGDNTMLVAPRTGDVVKYQQLSRTPHEIRRIV